MGDAGAKSGAKDFGERVPDFLIIGAKRSGTTWLNSMLEEHPEIYIGTKEIHYFDYQLDKGDGWYRAHFADAGPAQLAGEATQTYMFDREVPPEMARLVPEAKLIAALRNPVDRAYSDYWYNRARGIEDLSFEDALEAEGERGERYRKSYFSRGLYASQLRRVAEFYRRDQIAVFIFEEQVADPEHAYRGVCRYLGIDADFIPRTFGETGQPHHPISFPPVPCPHQPKPEPGSQGSCSVEPEACGIPGNGIADAGRIAGALCPSQRRSRRLVGPGPRGLAGGHVRGGFRSRSLTRTPATSPWSIMGSAFAAQRAAYLDRFAGKRRLSADAVALTLGRGCSDSSACDASEVQE